MTEKDHLQTNERSVLCHSKMVCATINYWECLELTNHVNILYTTWVILCYM
jgi:hypothetical protein